MKITIQMIIDDETQKTVKDVVCLRIPVNPRIF